MNRYPHSLVLALRRFVAMRSAARRSLALEDRDSARHDPAACRVAAMTVQDHSREPDEQQRPACRRTPVDELRSCLEAGGAPGALRLAESCCGQVGRGGS